MTAAAVCGDEPGPRALPNEIRAPRVEPTKSRMTDHTTIAAGGPQHLERPGRRPELTRLGLNLIVATYLMAVMNLTFWHKVTAAFAGDPRHVVVFGTVVWLLTLIILSAVSVRWLHRPMLALLIVVSAAASFFQDRLGVIIDREMIQNTMLTTVNESKHLITADLVLHVAGLGLLPAAVIFWPRLRPRSFRAAAWRWPVTLAVTFLVGLGLILTDFKSYSAAVREHRAMLGTYQPGATIGALSRWIDMRMASVNQVVRPLGTDAKKGAAIAAAKKPVLTVFFVGETARIANWGLAGYERDTTPELRRRDVIDFTAATSCGTNTAVSVPCMFSNLTAAGYSRPKFTGQENLLDVLAHAGVATDWWDNNTGDQGIAARVGAHRIDVTYDAEACAAGECTDRVLLKRLEQVLAAVDRDTVLVLHMIGSHGPSYFLRYPPEFERFGPTCRTPDFAKCSREEIVNAYDATILYTDHVLSRAIDMMSAQDRVIPAMLFFSDHGESLGENGLYLHGAPLFMAPETQRRVPFVMWLSPAYREALRVDAACLAARAAAPTSHDNVFHTVLGLMDVETSVRVPALDLVSGCRR